MRARREYPIFDGRAVYDVDEAEIMEWNDTLREAKSALRDYGGGVIVEHEERDGQWYQTGAQWTYVDGVIRQIAEVEVKR